MLKHRFKQYIVIKIRKLIAPILRATKMGKYKIGQAIYGNGTWDYMFPKGMALYISKITPYAGHNSQYGFEFSNFKNCGDNEGWHECWFTTEAPCNKMRVIRD